VLANAGVDIAQEVRAKRVLDRLSALVAPTATVIREGRPRRVGVEDVACGDSIELGPATRSSRTP
jgi:magnesium-transporting ATPase (P-type)